MVKTKAPLLSLGAAGSIGGVIIGSSWKGRSYFKKLTTPANPKTPAQVSVRLMLAFLTQHWASITPGDQATWEDLAEHHNITPLDAYVKRGLERWSTGHHPSETYPATEGGALPEVSTATLTLKGRGVKVAFSVAPFGIPQTCIVYHGTTIGFTAGYTNAVHFRDTPGAGTFTWLHTPLASGWHHYRTQAFSRTGRPSTTSTTQDIEVP